MLVVRSFRFTAPSTYNLQLSLKRQIIELIHLSHVLLPQSINYEARLFAKLINNKVYYGAIQYCCLFVYNATPCRFRTEGKRMALLNSKFPGWFVSPKTFHELSMAVSHLIFDQGK